MRSKPRIIQTVCDDAAHILRENIPARISVLSSNAARMGNRCCFAPEPAGVPRHVGATRIEVSEETPKGRALLLNQPIIIGDVRNDKRLRLPPFMREHGVVSTMAVVIPGQPGAFGVLGVDSKSPRAFSCR